MKLKHAFTVACIALSMASAAQAQVGFSATLGTTGAGLHVSVPLAPQLDARFGVNGLNYSHDGNTSDVDYDLKLKMRTVDALLDYYPMSTGFRVTGGIVYNGNKIDAEGRPGPGGTYTLNGRTYPAATVGSLNGQIDFRNIAPYLGIGWGNATSRTQEKGWGFTADLGVLFQGSPRTSLTNSGCAAPVLVCSQFAADVALENRSLQDEADNYKAFPVLRLGVNYRF